MVEIELSCIPDSEADVSALTSQLEEFRAQSGIKVHLRRMAWGSAWPDLMTFASHGKGPDISHVGGTWVSSLAMMNALRPFKPAEVEALGGEQAYMRSTWESTRQFNDARVWAVPWTGYIYTICYRKDLLAKAGVAENAISSDFRAMTEILQKLRESAVAEIPWLNPYIPAPYTDLVHIAASWMWSAGGDFVNADGTQVVFDSPQAIQGLCNWMETYRAVPEAYKQLDWVGAVALFREGRAAAVQTDIRTANNFVSRDSRPLIRENLGVIPIAKVPWTGGGNFVIWQHVLGYPEREKAAVELVKFLTNQQNGLEWARKVGSMPARMDVLREIYPPENPLHQAVMQSATYGRAYHTVPIWRRIEYQIAQELGTCLQQANAQPTEKSETILRAHMEPLARRLNLTLGR
jgi:multiple sugar transport system substrate-binding protein